MDLIQHIRNTLALTRRLHEAVTTDDQTLCQELLAERGPVMDAFAAAHRAANAAQRAECDDLVRELAEADAHLQEVGREQLELAAQQFRNSAGSVGNGNYDRPPQQACLDRRA